MREIRSSGSAEGVMSNHDPYSDSALRLGVGSSSKKPANPAGLHSYYYFYCGRFAELTPKFCKNIFCLFCVDYSVSHRRGS
jgi:hypothetical protein